MMDWTDRHCRYFMRLLSPSAFLYTEMVTANALHFGDPDALLRFDASEHPIAIQLGGSDVELMTEAAGKAAAAGYDEVNINVGCRTTFRAFNRRRCTATAAGDSPSAGTT